MQRDAVIFDLDDTLYRERRYALSGFAAVARWIESRFGVSAPDAMAVLVHALRHGHRAQAFQRLCDRFALDANVVPQLVQVMRTHDPRLRLAPVARRVLAGLWVTHRVAILTNGLPAVQTRKVVALGLGALVHSVVYAAEYGSGLGKPEAAAFLAACRTLRVQPGSCVFVGNDLARDIAGARAVGMKTILLARGHGDPVAAGADRHVTTLDDVPAAVAQFGREIRRAA